MHGGSQHTNDIHVCCCMCLPNAHSRLTVRLVLRLGQGHVLTGRAHTAAAAAAVPAVAGAGSPESDLEAEEGGHEVFPEEAAKSRNGDVHSVQPKLVVSCQSLDLRAMTRSFEVKVESLLHTQLYSCAQSAVGAGVGAMGASLMHREQKARRKHSTCAGHVFTFEGYLSFSNRVCSSLKTKRCLRNSKPSSSVSFRPSLCME